MIHYILTGHGEFAIGLSKALEMITGKQNNFSVAPFLETLSPEDYEKSINKILENINSETSEGTIIFTDLLGGTPFRISTELSQRYPKTEIIVGTNLPILVEGSLLRESIDNVEELAAKLVTIGKDGIDCIRLKLENESKKIIPEEGI